MPTTVTDRSLTGNDFSVFVSEQTTKDEINANPVFVPVRRTEGKGMKTISYTTSNMVKTDRQARQQVQDSQDLTSEISTEITKDGINFLISAIHASTDATTATETDIEATASGFASTNSNAFTNVDEGDYFWITGFTDSSIDGVYFVQTKSDSNTIDTTPVPPATEAVGAEINVVSNKGTNGKTQTYYAMQTRATDLSKAGEVDYHTIYDGIINTQNVEIGETGIVTSEIAMLFEKELEGSSIISGQTDSEESVDVPVSAVNGILDFYVNNASARCTVKSLSIEVNNNYQTDEAAACTKRYGYGDIEVTGSISVRAPISEPFTWRDYNWNGERVSIGVRLTHGNGEETVILMRQNVVTEISMPDGSNVISASEASYAAEEDNDYGTTIEIFRNWS